MNRVILFLFTFLFAASTYAQDNRIKRTTSLKDSILLVNFLTDFKAAIRNKDQNALSKLIHFSFYCRPCIDDTTLKADIKENSRKISKELFFKSQFHLFFEGKIERSLNKYDDLGTKLLIPVFNYDNTRQEGFSFPYTIVAPSAAWEGSQGFIYVDKVKGVYKITGIDTVP